MAADRERDKQNRKVNTHKPLSCCKAYPSKIASSDYSCLPMDDFSKHLCNLEPFSIMIEFWVAGSSHLSSSILENKSS